MARPVPQVPVPDQNGRHWLITGGTNGIGREVARAVAAAGADITLTARSAERGAAAAQELRALGAEDARVLRVDLSDLESVRTAAASLDQPIDVLLNNAGLATPRRQENAAGAELVLATNFLGPFALTNLIAPLLQGRVVITGSGAHRGGSVHRGDPHFRTRRWSFPAAYGQSKLADMLWARALQRRLDAQGRGVEVQLAHPGWAMTNIQNVTGSERLDRLVTAVSGSIAQSARDGAQPVLAAALWDLDPLTYIGPDGFRRWRGSPTIEVPADRALDEAEAEAVWELGIRETGTDLEGGDIG